MFIVSLTYLVPLEEVDKFLALHVSYLEEQYAFGNFIASGRKVPRTGGIIFSQVDSLQKLQAVLEKDPFKINNLAAYEIQEFTPTMTAQGFENLKDQKD